MFAWYWVADLCAEQRIEFVLGHALYMRAMHGGKSKNDRIDSEKIARLLRGGTFPLSYVYPAQMRSTRDLLRRRTFLMMGKALSLLAARLGRVVYWMLRRKEVFDWTAPLRDFSPPCPVPVGTRFGNYGRRGLHHTSPPCPVPVVKRFGNYGMNELH